MKEKLRRLGITMMTLLVGFVTVAVQSPVLAATVSKGGYISGGAISTNYPLNWSWSLSVGMDKLYVDGQLGYCLEPSIDVATNSAKGTPASSVTGLKTHPTRTDAPVIPFTKALQDKVALIANYGHGYPGHTGDDWIWATQKAIWQAVGHTVTGGTNVDAKVAEINALVADHYTLTSWDDTTRKVAPGQQVTVAGANNWVYSSELSKGVSVTTSGNNFIITVNNPSNARFVVDKKAGVKQGTSMIYSDGSSQKVLVAKLYDPVISIMNFEAAEGFVELHKQDTYGNDIAGTVFQIATDRNGTNGRNYTTGANGKVTTPGLIPGNYFVKEVSVPEPLVLDETWRSITINAGTTSTYTATNKAQRSDLTITKIENDWDTIQTEKNGIKLSDATIQLFAKTDIYEGSRRIYLADELVGEEITDQHGNVVFHNLPLGEYYAKELKAPEGYLLFDGRWDASIKFDGSQVTTEVTTTGYTVDNQVIYGKANLVKQDGNNTLLEGAVFGLFTAEGTKLLELRTGANGRIITPDLRYGEYYFQELEAPVGYWLSEEKHYFTIKEHEEMIYLTTNNDPIEAKLLVNKFDSETLQPLEGAKFKVRDLTTNEWVTVKFQEGKEVITKDEWATDSDGQFLLEVFLPYGTYQLVEVEAPEGYNLAAPINFTIDENQTYHELEIIGTVLESNVPNRPIRSDIQIAKVDALTGAYLPNFKFKLTNLVTMEETVGETGTDGLFTFEKLKYGRYMVEEIEVAGEYLIDRTPQFVDIIEDSIVYELEFENYQPVGEITLEKVDYKDGTPIAGAVYGLYKVGTDELVKEATTDEDGLAVFRGIALGDYYIQEISSPDGYIIDETQYEASVVYVDDVTPIIKVALTVDEMREVEIGTSASFVEMDPVEPDFVTIVDVVAYENLLIGKEYRVDGHLMNKEINEPILIDGELVTGSTTFTAEEHDGSVEVYFTFDRSKLETDTVVVFEDMYQEGSLIAVHHDINDVEQTVEIPKIGTEASVFERDEKEHNIVTLVDQVHYEGLVIGKEYTVTGVLMDQETGEALLIDGETITGTTVFTADQTEGTVDVFFTFDQSKLETDTVVVFEDMYDGERLIAVHHDIEDEAQTVELPTAETEASFVKRDKKDRDVVTVVDEVVYTGLVPGTEYVIKGKLMDKHTGKPALIDGKEITNSKTFTPEKSDGVVELEFTFDQSKLKTDAIVIFEYVYEGERLIVTHADIEAVSQTIEIVKVQLIKVDDKSGKPLAGAEFTMYDEAGKAITVRTTGEDGIAEFSVIQGEKVTIKETKSPTGYKLSDEVVEYEGKKGVKDNLHTQEYLNTKLPDLPNTGQGPSMLLTAGAVSVALGAVLMVITRKRETEEEA